MSATASSGTQPGSATYWPQDTLSEARDALQHDVASGMTSHRHSLERRSTSSRFPKDPHACKGSESAVSAICLYVRFTLGSGRHPLRLFLPKSAKNGHWHRMKACPLWAQKQSSGRNEATPKDAPGSLVGHRTVSLCDGPRYPCSICASHCRQPGPGSGRGISSNLMTSSGPYSWTRQAIINGRVLLRH